MAEEWRNLPFGSRERQAALDADLGAILLDYDLLDRRRLKLAIQLGEVLTEIKSERGHGNWLKHVADAFPTISERRIQKWTRAYRYQHILPRTPDGEYVHVGLEEALDWLSQHLKEQKELLKSQIRTEHPSGDEAQVEEADREQGERPADEGRPAVTEQEQPAVFAKWVPDNVESVIEFLPHLSDEAFMRVVRAIRDEAARRTRR